ncbi:hypothetical protein BD324DRAFT_653039 [Kockovaella imperatae]|uniref:Fork-head domain-containing protein n=1 Tax=Kockovaella imperatae TaxID=4999 RepID=A0A1Y1U9S0_9TREE|nr:hypothetical protein BD324DRAFT_653039 [Kockovaella imperatae]ORX34781.1 hypothetical protein BD324DRAFT_653039 [Kockovaella imperatae]
MTDVVMMQMEPYAQQFYASQIDPSLYDPSAHAMMTPATHHIGPNGMTMTMSDRSLNPHHYTQYPPDCGPSPFLPDDGTSPYGMQPMVPMQVNVSPMIDHLDATRYHGAELQRNHSLPLVHHPEHAMHFPPPRHRTGSASGSTRPVMQRGHTLAVPPRPPTLHRQASLQMTSARSASPHMMAGDLFDPVPGSPVKRASSSLGIPHDQHAVHHHVQFVQDPSQFFAPTQGISPARALGPAPPQLQRFAVVPPDNSMITPQNQKHTYAPAIHSSGTSSSITVSSATTADSSESAEPIASDEENDSPTRGPSASRALQKMQLNDRSTNSQREGSVTRQAVGMSRPQRPQSKVIGGRTSAKFAKVAEDPGVEGVPPGPRSMERPGPSFACIIGQAILKSSAGGLSLEHIYRYVETAYPYFKTGDGAWRNSVRHNLSIHKMFETIPRTEKFPPGKGGIWIIHEDEKCHWPEENKFIKNFPASHPHHGVCRQTLHERAKEKDAIEKAAREGRVYVPKKGKKARKLPSRDDEDGVDMVRTGSGTSMDNEYDGSVMMSQPTGHSSGLYLPLAQVTPQMVSQELPAVHMLHGTQDEDDGDFLPMEPDQHHQHAQEPMPSGSASVMVPPPPVFEKPRVDKRVAPPPIEDEENVFTTGKRVRLSEPRPAALAPILVQQQDFTEWDDTFITPERERPGSSSKATSSDFRTPALVNTSSSPGSSPMPPTITRATHHPSALQQAWTHDDMADNASVASPQSPPKLDEAFDIQPKATKMRTRVMAGDDDAPAPAPANHHHAAVPKTPLSRSSALREAARTPATSLSKTPLFSGRSPAQPPPSVTALLSTPLWEVGGCLDRLKGYGGSPTQIGRSPVPPTSPTRYAMLLDSGASPSARKLREFNL